MYNEAYDISQGTSGQFIERRKPPYNVIHVEEQINHNGYNSIVRNKTLPTIKIVEWYLGN